MTALESLKPACTVPEPGKARLHLYVSCNSCGSPFLVNTSAKKKKKCPACAKAASFPLHGILQFALHPEDFSLQTPDFPPIPSF